MAHTPGPWHSDGYERVRPENGPQDGTNDICHVYSRRDGTSVEANASLIAAAPDLLVACRSAKAWLEYCDMADTAQHARLTDAIKKAIGA